MSKEGLDQCQARFSAIVGVQDILKANLRYGKDHDHPYMQPSFGSDVFLHLVEYAFRDVEICRISLDGGGICEPLNRWTNQGSRHLKTLFPNGWRQPHQRVKAARAAADVSAEARNYQLFLGYIC